MDDHARFDHLIGLIYDAAVAPERWPAALEAVGDALGGCAFVMSALPSCGVPKFVATPRVDPERAALIEQRYASAETNPLVAAMPRLPVAVPVAREAILTDRHYLRGDLYNDVFRPQRLAHAAVACVLRTPDCIVPLGVLGQSGSGRPDRRDLDLLARLLPHLRRSVQLYLRVGSLEARRSAVDGVFDGLPFGIILIDAGGRAVFLNRSAEIMVRAADGLTVSGGVLRASRPRDTSVLHRLIAEAIATSAGTGAGGGGTMPLLRREPRRPLNVLVAPVALRCEDIGLEVGADRPAAVIVITDPETSPEPPTAALQRLHGLTLAEATLARALAGGRSLKEHAESTRTSAETVRWHLKNIFLKTETNRQAELVQLILKAAPPRQA